VSGTGQDRPACSARLTNFAAAGRDRWQLWNGIRTVRAMLSFSFFKFGQRLESKAGQLGKQVVGVREAHTRKTASWTGEMKQIGGAKTIVSGGVRADRDLNGARGIFLRALGDAPSLSNEGAFVGVQ
jgi:putative transposase